MRQYRTTKIENGEDLVDFLYFRCSYCEEEIPESTGVHEIEDDYICYDCIRELFFETHDTYSIPLMEETKGLLRYTLKARGRRRALPPEIREKVFKRDKYTCKHCGTKNKKYLSVDHIHPYSKGGKDSLSNFQTLCRSCNSKKGAKLL